MKVPPLHKKSFYLDLNGFRGVEELARDIVKLGGSVESFLSKGVKYLVTNRDDWKYAASSFQSNSYEMSPSPFQSTRSDGTSMMSPLGEGSNNEIPRLKTRGQALVEKSIFVGKMKGSCDIIQNAHNFGTKVLPLSYTLKWIKKRKESTKNENSSCKSKKPCRSSSSSTPTRKLKSPFLKFEPFNRLYRPIYKEFMRWPTFYFEGNDVSSPFQTGKNVTNEERKPKETRKRRYHHCEICLVQYKDLEEHLQEKRHISYSENPENFKLLDEVICSIFNRKKATTSNWNKDHKCGNDESKKQRPEPTQKVLHKPKINSKNTIRKLDGSLKTGKQLRVVLGNIGNLMNGKLMFSTRSSPDKSDANQLLHKDGNDKSVNSPSIARVTNDSAFDASVDQNFESISAPSMMHDGKQNAARKETVQSAESDGIKCIRNVDDFDVSDISPLVMLSDIQGELEQAQV